MKELAKWLGIRNDKLNEKLKEAGIKTTDLSRNSRFRFVSLADLAKADPKITPYRKKDTLRSSTKTIDGSAPDKEAQMTLQGMKERIVFLTGNPDEDKRLKGELMNSDCFGKMYGTDDCCQNCTRPVDLDGTKGPLKLFCQAISK
jgi:hypothetical protein